MPLKGAVKTPIRKFPKKRSRRESGRNEAGPEVRIARLVKVRE